MSKKQQFVVDVHEKMSDWDRRIEEIIKAADRRDDQSEILRVLLDKRKEAKAEFERLENSGDAAFEDQKARVNVANKGLESVLVRAAERFDAAGRRDDVSAADRGERPRAHA